MFSAKKPLSNLEQLVMRVLWERGSATSEEVREALAKRHFMKESTARTILRRLEEKGYVSHRVEGRTNIYSGMEPPSNVAAKAVRNIIDRFCGGSIEQLLVGMVESEVIDSRELADLARKISRRKTRKGE
ncbi:MAG: BlaI/MecI/CopY family transcriptional regulator [Acidobacteria bacterium]|nr:BlaI/MecI/CopY family transcriptional regulator [Acidobacteriota bacterium]